MSKKSYIVSIHILVWIICLSIIKIYDFLSISYFDYRSFTWFSLISGTIINAFIFYGNSLFLLPKTLSKKITVHNYIFISIATIVFLTTIEGFADFLFNKLTNPFWDNITTELSLEYFDLTFLINLLFLLLSFGYGFILEWNKNEITKRKLTQDKVQTELNLLKTQIKPHFLFNTLNNIFGLASKSKDSSVANSISRLADIMRYLTYETNEGKIVLSKEIDYLKNYIELQKLRFSKEDTINIEFHCSGNPDELYIEQMILLPLVENAFKHGISLQNKTEIIINLEIEKSKLNFSIINTINRTNNNEISDSGLGLDNLRRRLKLLYPEKHHLEIEEKENHFEVFLSLEYETRKD